MLEPVDFLGLWCHWGLVEGVFERSGEVSRLEFSPSEIGELVHSNGVGCGGWVGFNVFHVLGEDVVSVVRFGSGSVKLSVFCSEGGELRSVVSSGLGSEGVDGYSGCNDCEGG